MEKMIIADNTEIEIQEGSSIDRNVVIVEDFADLKAIAESLTKEGNMKIVKYKSNDQITGIYENMKLEIPLFFTVDYTDDKKVIAVFGIREKTVYEKEMDKVKLQLSVHDAAVTDLGEAVSQISQA